MSEEIMITVKQADGTMKQVPLSSVTKNAGDAKNAKEASEAKKVEKVEEALKVTPVPVVLPTPAPEVPEPKVTEVPPSEERQELPAPVVKPTVTETELTHDIVPLDVLPPATTTPNTHVFDKEGADEKDAVKIQEPVFSDSPKKKRRKNRNRNRKNARARAALIPSPAATPAISVPNEHVFEHAAQEEVAPAPTQTPEVPKAPKVAPPKQKTKEDLSKTLNTHAAADTVWKPADSLSPLEDTSIEAKIVPNKIIVQIPEAVQTVITENNVVLDERLQKRLSGLIDTAVRHVRTPAQFVDALKKEVARGGMGLEEVVAESVLEVLHLVQKEVDSAPVVDAPKVPEPVVPVPVVAPAAPTEIAAAPKKVPMNDITVPAPKRMQTMDPIEELAALTLDDFRRIGGREAIGLAEVKNKFEVLLKESITVYLKGVAAWHQSPLFLAYIQVVTQSVNTNTPIAQLLTGGDTFTVEEWQAIGEIQSEIRL